LGVSTEVVLRLHEDGRFGLLTRPDAGPCTRVVVLFNAGLTHRSGPQRFHVELARRLSAGGATVFRFDLPGVGDAAHAGATSQEAAVAQAFDALQAATGAASFVVGGICSAADLGWRVAVADPRVQGLLLIDPMAVRGPWFRVGRWRMALRSAPSSWPAKLARRLRGTRGAVQAGADTPVPLAIDAYRGWPTPDAFRTQAAALLARGVRMLELYTGGVSDYLLHARQIDATFGLARRHAGLRVHFRPDLDHILFALAHRREVIALVDRWLRDAFPGR
jgi:hypothetical protein